MPLEVGAVQLTEAPPTPGVAVTLLGADGVPGGGAIGVTGDDGGLAGPVPTAFTAATVKVYAVPLVSPVTVAPVPFTVTCAGGAGGLMATTYPVTGLPPVLAGAVQDSDADWSPALAATAVGAPGTVGVVTGLLRAGGPVPLALKAATAKL